MKKVLITGSAGGIGTAFRTFAKDRYEFVCFDRVPTPGVPEAGCVVADLVDTEALNRAAVGCDAMVHLGAFRNDANFMKVILPNNILGTYNAYEAARLAGVKRFVFASSVQVDDGYSYDVTVDSLSMPRLPENYYAVSKGFGEDLGRVYSARGWMSVVCLRLGWVALKEDMEFMVERQGEPMEITITERDCCEIIAHSIEAQGLDFAALQAFSRNAASIRDLSPLKRLIGYVPQDDAFELVAARRWPLEPTAKP
jgi:nucleoside-diphosphate-sugar epimerase